MKELLIIPKPVSIKYNDGEFVSDKIPLLNKKEVKLEGEEAYRLIIEKDKITVEAGAPAGIFRGEQTFRQLTLSEFKEGKFCLPCAEITDYPRFPWRGFMLDCSRYFYSVAFIEKIIDALSMHHINRFHWHLTDDQGWRFFVPEYPLLSEIGARRHDHRFPWETFPENKFYTDDDIRRVVDYAAKHHVEVIPEVDLPGHASAILACYPGLGCTGGPYRVEDRYGIFEDVLCAGNNRIYDFFNAVFDTLARLFPSKWVHMGGDEVLFNRWKECLKCRKKMEEEGFEKPEDLQSMITCVIVKMLAERNRIAIGWDEILEDTPKYRLPKEAVVMSWRGVDGGIKACNMGHKVIMSPTTNGCYLDYKHLKEPEETGRTLGLSTVEMGYLMNPVTPQIKEPSLVLGGQGNLWSEVIYAGKIAEYMIFPRMCAIAEGLWTPLENKNLDDFSRRLDVHRQRLDKLEINQYRGPLK